MSPLTPFDILKSKFVRYGRSVDPDEQNWAVLDDHVKILTNTGETVLLYPNKLLHRGQQFDIGRITLFWMHAKDINSVDFVPPDDPEEYKMQNYGNIVLRFGFLRRKEHRIDGLQQAVFPLMSYISWLQERN